MNLEGYSAAEPLTRGICMGRNDQRNIDKQKLWDKVSKLRPTVAPQRMRQELMA